MLAYGVNTAKETNDLHMDLGIAENMPCTGVANQDESLFLIGGLDIKLIPHSSFVHLYANSDI